MRETTTVRSESAALFRIGSPGPTQRLRRVLALLASLLFVTGLTLRIAGISAPRWLGMRSLFLLLVLTNVAWWTLADEAVRALVRPQGWRRFGRLALGAVILVLALPLLGMVFAGRLPTMVDWPIWLASGYQLWLMSLVVLGVIATAAGYSSWGLWWLFRRIRRGHNAVSHSGASIIHANGEPSIHADAPNSSRVEKPPTSLASSRREFLKTAGILTPVALAGGMNVGLSTRFGRFAVRTYDLSAPWLPDRLRGLTLTHVSDLHLGRLYRPAMLPRLVDEVNGLKSDLIVITGDVVDTSNDLLPPAIAAFKQFEARRGVVQCIGNHDLIDDREQWIDAMRDAGLKLLVDQRRTLLIDGERITLAGMDWTGNDDTPYGSLGHKQHAERTLVDYDSHLEGPIIALAHHPHAFDALAARGVPLTLSGHTHGGQLMFSPPRADGQGDPAFDHGVGGLLFRYLRGFYHQGGKTLFVNSGVGNWFPIRWNSPAEIVQIRLV